MATMNKKTVKKYKLTRIERRNGNELQEWVGTTEELTLLLRPYTRPTWAPHGIANLLQELNNTARMQAFPRSPGVEYSCTELKE